MQRQGKKSASLERFEVYALHAKDLEERKFAAKYAKKTKRLRSSKIIRAHEEALDAAWESVDLISREYSELAASIIADHYLFGIRWTDTAYRHNSTPDGVKKRAYRAFKWLDAQEVKHDKLNE